jgi:hypothetical protein
MGCCSSIEEPSYLDHNGNPPPKAINDEPPPMNLQEYHSKLKSDDHVVMVAEILSSNKGELSTEIYLRNYDAVTTTFS